MKDVVAYVVSSPTFAAGGVKITRDAEVVNRDGERIPGLYAGGEMIGLYYRIYVGVRAARPCVRAPRGTEDRRSESHTAMHYSPFSHCGTPAPS